MTIYILALHNECIGDDKFGISFKKEGIEIWYSIEQNKVALFDKGERVNEIDFKKYFSFG